MGVLQALRWRCIGTVYAFEFLLKPDGKLPATGHHTGHHQLRSGNCLLFSGKPTGRPISFWGPIPKQHAPCSFCQVFSLDPAGKISIGALDLDLKPCLVNQETPPQLQTTGLGKLIECPKSRSQSRVSRIRLRNPSCSLRGPGAFLAPRSENHSKVDTLKDSPYWASDFSGSSPSWLRLV